jgi:uncharacterized protein YdhG (YjbR/CyaY superfamily)
MPSAEIDRYLTGMEQPKRRTLEALRRTILSIVPDAVQGISYGMPVFKVGGKAVCGFAAFKEHLSYFPHSGSVLPRLAKEFARYSMTKGALRFAIDKPLPHALVKKLIAVRLAELQRR